MGIVTHHRIKNNCKKSVNTLIFAGTGKTYASAFAMRELGFKKVLFLVHRNQIAKQAMKSYRKIFDGIMITCKVIGEHAAVKWLTKENIDSVEWLPANLGLVEKIKTL